MCTVPKAPAPSVRPSVTCLTRFSVLAVMFARKTSASGWPRMTSACSGTTQSTATIGCPVLRNSSTWCVDCALAWMPRTCVRAPGYRRSAHNTAALREGLTSPFEPLRTMALSVR